MSDLITIIVAGVEVILLGSETVLEFMVDTEILGATLYAWFLGYIVIDTIISLFFPSNTVDEDTSSLSDMLGDSETPEGDYELD